jgi:hypothetical protein
MVENTADYGFFIKKSFLIPVTNGIISPCGDIEENRVIKGLLLAKQMFSMIKCEYR